MHSKFHAERACAHNADIFTTVSEITGQETKKLLGKEPDMILSNGLDIQHFPTFEEASVRHRLFRDKIREFLMAYFFPYYTFDLKESLTFFSFGRPEYHVKGIDMYIDALAALNKRLQPNDKTVIAFIFVPGDISNIKQEIIENLTSMADIKEELSDNFREIKLNMLSSILSEAPLRKQAILPPRVEQLIEKRRRKMQRIYKKPPICTHDLHNEETDQIMLHLKRVGLTNERHKKVKVIYYPRFLTGADGLLNTDYFETISGGHLGVFPSFYEPFGYTPLECSAMGVPSITTDMAGFGQYINTLDLRDENAGIFVVDRAGNSYEHATEKITQYMHWYTQLIRPQRIENKIHAKEIADRLDWKYMIINYIRAQNEAMQRAQK